MAAASFEKFRLTASARARSPSTNVVNDEFDGKKLLVAYAKENGTAKAWERELPDIGELTFTKDPAKPAKGEVYFVRDDQTGSLWSWMTGTAIDGELKGKQLGSAAHHPILNDRFPGFYPKGPVFQAN